MAYSATYAGVDIAAMVVDFIGFVMAALAAAASMLVFSIMVIIILAFISAIILSVEKWQQGSKWQGIRGYKE